MSSITTRAAKGSALTHAEVDANFTNLNSGKAEVSGQTFTGAVVLPAGSATAGGVQVGTGTTYKPSIYSPGTDQLAISTGGTQRAQIDSSGRLLVGVSTYGGASNIYPTSNGIIDLGCTVANVPAVLKLGNTGFSNTAEYSTGAVEFRGFDSGGNSIGFASVEGLVTDATSATRKGSIVFKTISASTVSEKMRITSAGLVGIGTSAPQTALHVAGTTDGDQLRISQSGQVYKIGRRASDGSLMFTGLQTSFTAFRFGTDGNEERVVIDSSGRLLVGTSTARSMGGISAGVFIEGTAYNSLSINNNTNDSFSSLLAFGKSRGTTNGAVTIVSNGDRLGAINFYGADGSTNVEAARIAADVDGTPGANDMPGRLVFSTTADGAASPTERMRIKSTGIINFSNAPTYADNTTATAGGLAVGDVYKTALGVLMIRY
jgi:hypothetical protein